MKIELPCEIVRDLLPVCIEGIADPVSREAVETHLLSCEKCRQLKDNMTNTDGSIENLKKNAETQEDAVLFKKIKKKLNKKAKAAIGISLAVIVIVVFGFQLLFNMPVKNVDLDDISVSANVYAFSDLLEAEEIDGAA
ncbi:MAG: zf-HC2 domain-containing protein, partial [Oscillospiraceae bacterium]|nr:zf-HC2 domain-containing protein [Oscillospiraceae bacterium]